MDLWYIPFGRPRVKGRLHIGAEKGARVKFDPDIGRHLELLRRLRPSARQVKSER